MNDRWEFFRQLDEAARTLLADLAEDDALVAYLVGKTPFTFNGDTSGEYHYDRNLPCPACGKPHDGRCWESLG